MHVDSEKISVQDEEMGKGEGAIPPGADDPSTKMWILSISQADKHDSEMVERWKDDMDGILIYTGVFSATVAAFLLESYKFLKPDPTDVSAKLLQQVTQELAGISNGDHFTSPTLDTFKPPRYAIRVNILWFLSLCIALSCGLGATLVQQWVRRYRKLTQHSDSPTHRVRIRTFLFDGIKEFQVRMVVENVSLLLHAAIFLFFVGLVEFLFAINDEVAQAVVAIIGFFAVLYIGLTSLPVIFRQCPFQTPLTAVFWYMSHVVLIVILSPFTCCLCAREKVTKLWKYIEKGFDEHILESVRKDDKIDQRAVKMTLGICRGETEVEAFLEAVPGYLETGDYGSRFGDIKPLLRSDLPLVQQMAHLFSSCTHGDGKLNDVERRHRAVTCSRVVFELSKASPSVKDFTLDLPKSLGHKLYQLSHDHDPKIAFEAVRAIAVLERALLKRLLDVEDGDDMAGYKKAADLLAAATGANDPTSPRRQTGPHNDDDGHLTAVTEFASSILALTKRPWQPTRQDIEAIKLALDELCRGLNGRDFSPATQEHFINVFNETRRAHLEYTPADTQSSSESHHSIIIRSLECLLSTLDTKFLELLEKPEFAT